MVKIIKVFVFVIFVSVSSYGQTAEQEQFIKLYKENYIEWISSPEIAKMQERDPELKQIINAIPIQETNAFKEAFKKAEMERGQDSVQDITAMLGDGAFDVSMDIIKEFLAKENTDIIINMYWQVIKSEKSRAEAQKRNPSFLAYIEEKVSLLVFEQKKGKVKNPQGYLIKALEEDYVNFEYLNQIKRKEQQQKARERTALKNEKEKALQKLKTKSYNLNLKNLKIILGSIKPTVFFEAVEDANIGTMFKVELDKSKSPLENYEIQSASGRIPILNKMIANYKSDFETAEKKALDKKIKEVEKALRQI